MKLELVRSWVMTMALVALAGAAWLAASAPAQAESPPSPGAMWVLRGLEAAQAAIGGPDYADDPRA